MLLCSCQLLSSPMGSRLYAPTVRDALFLSHFQLHEVYKPPESSKIIQSSTCLCLDNISPRLVSTFISTAAAGFPIPSRPLLFLYHLACGHEEDRSSSLAKSRPLLKNVLTNAPSVSSQHFGCHRHLHRNILVTIVVYIATFPLPESLHDSGRAIQVHTQECAIQLHGTLVLQAS